MGCVCPWWLGYILINPLRKLIENPVKTLRPYIKTGMKILEVGPGMGFFTVPMATMLNGKGCVYAVDLQEKMLSNLRKRISKAGVDNVVETRICRPDSLGIQDLNGQTDLAVLIYVIHEVPDQKHFFSEIHKALKNGALVFIAEPWMHVSKKDFLNSVEIAKNTGFKIVKYPLTSSLRSVLLKK